MEPPESIEERKLALEREKFEYQKMQDAKNRQTRTARLIAFLAVVVTAGQLVVAYLSYQTTVEKNKADIEKLAVDTQKIQDDIEKNHDDGARAVAELVLSHSKDLFDSRQHRNLVQKIVESFQHVPFAAALREELLAATTDPKEKQERVAAFAAHATRPAVYIHYRRPEDKARLVDLVRRLKAQGYTSYAEPEQSKEELSTPTQFMYFKNNDEKEAMPVRDAIADLLGIPKDKLMLTRKADIDNARNVFAVWISELPTP